MLSGTGSGGGRGDGGGSSGTGGANSGGVAGNGGAEGNGGTVGGTGGVGGTAGVGGVGTGGASPSSGGSDAGIRDGGAGQTSDVAVGSGGSRPEGGGVCAPGLGDCDGVRANGCETDVLTSVAHCGACNVACANAHGGTACVTGVCAPSCASGFDDCDGNRDNGCEADLGAASSCGACGVTCANAHGTTSCSAGSCKPVCAGGYVDCDGDPSNGCETANAACGAPFPYTPTNFNPTDAGIDPTATAPTTTLDCGVTTFDSTTLQFQGWCGAQPKPVPVVQTQAGGPDIVVVPLRGFDIQAGSTLRLVGSRPVVIAIYGSAVISGIIDGSGADFGGAGSDWACGASAGGQGTGGCGAAGGGGGGGFATKGANGGDGNTSSINPGAHGVGGNARGSAGNHPLFGGCNGGNGGGCSAVGGGHGGGAIQVSAAGDLLVRGTILADGQDGPTGQGSGCCTDRGGTGGGSGGAIVLEGNTFNATIGSKITANGGKGASSGSGLRPGGNGGTGYLPPVDALSDVSFPAGGGGGAVGRGFIRAIASCDLAGLTSLSLSTSGCSVAPDANCTNGTLNGRLYWFCDGPLNFADASAKCMKAGFQLASIGDPAENTFIKTPLGQPVYVGLTDRSDYSIEGTFVWQNREVSAYRNWNTGEPNDGGGAQDCVTIDPAGLWSDVDCAGARPFVCEQSDTNVAVQVPSGTSATLNCPMGIIQSYTTLFGSGCQGTCPVACGTCAIGGASCTIDYSSPACADCDPACSEFGSLSLACTPNLLTNPGFETGTFSGWPVSGGSTVTSAAPRSGAYAANVDPIGNVTQYFVPKAGAQYTFSAWGKLSAATGTEASPAVIGIQCFRGANGTGTKLCDYSSVGYSSDTTYRQFTQTFTVPLFTASLVIYAWKDVGNRSFYVDDFSLTTP